MIRANSKRGFSLIEVVVAVMVITVTMVAVSGLVGQNLRQNQLNQSMITAHYLSVEALEAVRNMRDSNWLQNFSFDVQNGFWGADIWPQSAKQAYILSRGDADKPWLLETTEPLAEKNRLYLANDGLHFQHRDEFSTGRETNFSRYLLMEIRDGASDAEEFAYADYPPLKVTAVTEFTVGDRTREVRYDMLLTDWKQGPL